MSFLLHPGKELLGHWVYVFLTAANMPDSSQSHDASSL